MDHSIEVFTKSIDGVLEKLLSLKNEAVKHQCSELVNENIENSIIIIKKIHNEIKPLSNRIRPNYLLNISTQLNKIDTLVRDVMSVYTTASLDHLFDGMLKNNIENKVIEPNFNQVFKNTEFICDFFIKLNFLSTNIVAIGANGSGKTLLSAKLKQILGEDGMVVSAQKILIIPTFTSLTSYQITQKQVKDNQNIFPDSKRTYSTDKNETNHLTSHSFKEFKDLLEYLLSEKSHYSVNYVNLKIKEPNTTQNPEKSTIDKVFEIWNSVITHKEITSDGLNIYLKDKSSSSKSYSGHLMSEGEKITLYYICYVLLAKENGFIIIDEPEMYLNKNILNKLWDKLEILRSDCIFMYLTHDIDFATSRFNSKKVWVKSFTYPETWDIERIPDNTDLPENLILDLIGSRKNILFCEGDENSSLDYKIYNILFPNLTIKPVGSCEQVIRYTKAFNKNQIFTTNAFGIVDSDHMSQDRKASLKNNKIFPLKVAEVENLLLDENFLQEFFIFKKFNKDHLMNDAINKIKESVIEKLSKQKDIQASNYISAKIDYYFKSENLQKGNSFDRVNENLKNFISKINIQNDYNSRLLELNNIISNNDYKSAIKVFNEKGLKEILNSKLKIKNFHDDAIGFLSININAQNIIKQYFHTDLIQSI